MSYCESGKAGELFPPRTRMAQAGREPGQKRGERSREVERREKGVPFRDGTSSSLPFSGLRVRILDTQGLTTRRNRATEACSLAPLGFISFDAYPGLAPGLDRCAPLSSKGYAQK